MVGSVVVVVGSVGGDSGDTGETTTTTTTPVFEDGLVVMWSRSYENPSEIKYFNLNGTESQLDWGYDNGYATADSRCSFMFQGDFWVLGIVSKFIVLKINK